MKKPKAKPAPEAMETPIEANVTLQEMPIEAKVILQGDKVALIFTQAIDNLRMTPAAAAQIGCLLIEAGVLVRGALSTDRTAKPNA